ncbi:MAG: hypothetical protein M3347_10300, partial [Armatimonadota bacterium]|nr:hypothetical protein [Armatimonadota bacterium]
MKTVITSRQHPLCKLARSLHEAKGRRRHKLFVVEGGNAVSAALQARWPLQRLLATPDDLQAGWDDLARTASIETQPVAAEILEYLSDAQTAPDVLALAVLPDKPVRNWDVDDLLLVLDGISDPGNVGTLIRTADAAGAGAVALTENSADPFGPKVVRASAGSLFHLPPLPLEQRVPDAVAQLLRARAIPIVTAVAHGGLD